MNDDIEVLVCGKIQSCFICETDLCQTTKDADVAFDEHEIILICFDCLRIHGTEIKRNKHTLLPVLTEDDYIRIPLEKLLEEDENDIRTYTWNYMESYARILEKNETREYPSFEELRRVIVEHLAMPWLPDGVYSYNTILTAIYKARHGEVVA